jgi:hypothetical protein
MSRDDESVLSDALAELIYWAKSNGVDFDAALARGRSYFANRV